MEERQVTVDGTTRPLPPPFMVIATQNPVEQEGTYRLPESQLDRFLLRISLGYPGRTAEIAILDGLGAAETLRHLNPVVSSDEIKAMITEVRGVYLASALKSYMVDLVRGQPAPPGRRARPVAAGHARSCRLRHAPTRPPVDATTPRPTM